MIEPENLYRAIEQHYARMGYTISVHDPLENEFKLLERNKELNVKILALENLVLAHQARYSVLIYKLIRNPLTRFACWACGINLTQ